MKHWWNHIGIRWLLVTLMFFVITSPIVVLFGPFANLKQAVVGAIVRSRHPHYITWLFDQQELDRILGRVQAVPEQDIFNFKVREDKTLKLQKIESDRFVGYLWEIPNPKRIQVATAADINDQQYRSQ